MKTIRKVKTGISPDLKRKACAMDQTGRQRVPPDDRRHDADPL